MRVMDIFQPATGHDGDLVRALGGQVSGPGQAQDLNHELLVHFGEVRLKNLGHDLAQQVGEAINIFQEQRTGYPPKAVTVVLSDDTLVVTLHEALSPAEKALSRTPEGAAQVQEYHRQLFKDSVDLLRQEIKRITGVAVGEAVAEMETTTGAIVHAFTTGTMVQVFQLAGRISADAWNGNGSSDRSQDTPSLAQPLSKED